MQTIEILKENIETGSGHSSKGNQLKWEQDGWWYKADAFGFESLAAVLVSRLLSKSTLAETPQYLVEYEPVNIIYKGNTYRGCRSRNFKGQYEELIPLERLARIHTGFSLAKEMGRIYDVGERISHAVELVQNVTGLDNFGSYLAGMLEIDAFFLNEDRHTNNIAVLYDTMTKEYRLCPYFDMGLSLFSDEKEAYPFTQDFVQCRKKIEAKPFSRDFDEQLDEANERYGSYLKFELTKHEMEEEVQKLAELGIYTEEELTRVEEVLRYQAGKYLYMVKG